jgi:hypothetical protein
LPNETTEAFGVFGQAAQLSLNEGKSLLERGELLEELLLGEFQLRDIASFLFLSVTTTFHDDTPWRCVLGWVDCLAKHDSFGSAPGTTGIFFQSSVATYCC